MEILPIQVSLLINKLSSNIYELDTEQRCLLQKSKNSFQSSGVPNASKKIFLDHIQLLEESNDLLLKKSKMEEQIQLLTSGYNSGIFTLNTRDPQTKFNGLLVMALKLLKETLKDLNTVRIFYCLIGITDGRCIDLVNERSLQIGFLKKKLSSLYTQAHSVTDLITLIQRPLDFPFVLLIKLDGMFEFQTQLCLADLGWSHATYKVPRTTPILTDSISKLKDIVQLLYQLPYHGRILYDTCVLTLLTKDFIGGNSRTSFIFQADLDDPETSELLKFAEVLRKVKHFVQPIRADPSLFLHQEKLEQIKMDLEQREYALAQHAQLIEEQRLVILQNESQLEQYKLDVQEGIQWTSTLKEEIARVELEYSIAQMQLEKETLEKFNLQLAMVENREQINKLLYVKSRVEVEREFTTIASKDLESELQHAMIMWHIQEETSAFYFRQRDEIEASENKFRQEAELFLQDYHALAEHVNDLKSKLKNEQNSSKDLVKLNKSLERTIEKHKSEHTALQKRYTSCELALKKQEEEVALQLKTVSEISSESDIKDEKISELQNMLQQLESQCSSLTRDVQSEKAKRDLAHEKLRTTYLQREQQSMQRFDQLRQQHQELQSEYDQLQFHHKQLQQDTSDFESKLNLAQSKIKQLEKQLQQQRNQQKKETSKEDPEWVAMKEEWNKQENELYDEIKKLNTQLKKIEVQKQSMQNEIKRLQIELSGSESMSEELKTTLSNLNAKLNSKEKLIISLQKELHAQKSSNEQLKERLYQNEQAALAKAQQLDSAAEKNSMLQQELQSYHHELESTTKELERRQSLTNKDFATSKNKEKQLQQSLNHALEQLQKEKEKNKKEMMKVQAEREQLLATQKNMVQRIEHLESQELAQPTSSQPPDSPTPFRPRPKVTSSKPIAKSSHMNHIASHTNHFQDLPPLDLAPPSLQDPGTASESEIRPRRQAAINSSRKLSELDIESPSRESFDASVFNPVPTSNANPPTNQVNDLPRGKRLKKSARRSPSPSPEREKTKSVIKAKPLPIPASPTMLSPTLAALEPTDPPSLVKLRKKRKLGPPKSMLQIVTTPQSKLGSALAFLNDDFNVPNLREKLH